MCSVFLSNSIKLTFLSEGEVRRAEPLAGHAWALINIIRALRLQESPLLGYLLTVEYLEISYEYLEIP